MKTQFNPSNGNIYQGQNQSDLQLTKQLNSYQSDGWVTFLQARNLGLKIIRGNKGTSIFRGYSTAYNKDKNGKIKKDYMPLGFAKVFNLDQTQKV